MSLRWFLAAVSAVSLLVSAPVAALPQLGGGAPSEVDAGIRFDDPTRNVGFDQRLGEELPQDGAFLDHEGQPFRLSGLDPKRPKLLVPVYYECPRLCTMVLDGVVRSLRVLKLEPGKDFELVAFSFDPGETPEMARQSREHFLRLYERPDTEAGWHFLTAADPKVSGELCEALGFRFAYDERIDEYAHAAGIVVGNTKGRISHYFYGVEYSAKDLRLAMVDASQGEVGNLVDSVLLFCFNYDPRTGRYGLVIMNVLRLGGVATVVALALCILWYLRAERRKPSTLGGSV